MLSKPVKSIDLFLFIIFVFLLLPRSLKCQTVNLTFEADRYEAFIGSPSLTLTCRGTNMKSVDVVWLTYMASNFNSEKAIYSDNKYLGNAANKYFINITQLPNDTLVTSLTIFNVQQQDFSLAYRCECNIYKRCSNTNHARDSIAIRALKPPVFSPNPSNLTKKRNASSCIDGPYNTTQYFLYLMTFFILLACTFLLYFCDQRSPNEKFFLIFIVLIAAIFMVTSTIIWINSEFVQKSSFIALTIVCLFLMGCIILWTLNLNLAIRLNLIYEIRSLIYMLYLLEGFSAILSIVANVYCTGSSQLPALTSFDYSYLELIGSGFLLIFSLFLLLTFGIIFYCITIQEKNNDDQKITKFFKIHKNLVRPSVSSSAGMRLSNVSLDKLSRPNSSSEKQPVAKSPSEKHNSPISTSDSRNSNENEKKVNSRINSVIGSISQLFSHHNADKVTTINNVTTKIEPEKAFITKSGINASSIFIEKTINTSQHNDSNTLDYIKRENSKLDLNSHNTDKLTQLGHQQMDLFEKKLNLDKLDFPLSNTNSNTSNTNKNKPVNDANKKETFFEVSEFKRSVNNMSKSSFGDTVFSSNHHNSTPSTSDSEKSKKSASAVSIETVKTNTNKHNRIRINIFESAREKSKEEYNRLYKKLKNTREQFANNKLKNIHLKY